MKATIIIILLLSLIGCDEQQNKGSYYICTPMNSMDCKEVDSPEYERYMEQYQVCEVHNNVHDCLNMYEF